MFFHFGFDKRTLTENVVYGVIGWFKNSRFRSLNSKPTFLSVITGIIITYLGGFMEIQKCLGANREPLQ